MTAKDIKNWLEGLTEEELDLEVFAGSPNEDGEYMPVEKLVIAKTTEGTKAVFMEPLTDAETEELLEGSDEPDAKEPKNEE